MPVPGGWGGVFGDQAVAAAMIDRIVHHADVLMLKGREATDSAAKASTASRASARTPRKQTPKLVTTVHFSSVQNVQSSSVVDKNQRLKKIVADQALCRRRLNTDCEYPRCSRVILLGCVSVTTSVTQI